MTRNTFYYGDCKFVMGHDVVPESIDLIYLDPPFYTGQVQRGTAKWNPAAMEISYDDSRKFWAEKGLASIAPVWMKDIAKKNNERAAFAAYLYYMMERLELCKKVLKQTGSIYLHCDYRASHYLKMVMDEIFGVENFRNEITWSYSGGATPKRWFPRKHDTIFFYVKGDKYTFNIEYKPFAPSTSRHNDGSALRDEGTPITDSWDDLRGMGLVAKENTGYPTQKPLKLLKRIILASSNEGDIVLDPFCGCGTTILAAQKLNRRWIGIDINKDAYNIFVERERREREQGKQPSFGMTEELMTPYFICRDLEAVKNLPHDEFEFWVNEYYKATKPSPDAGIDGITKDGIPIQTKAWNYKVDDSTIRQFAMDIQMHPAISQPAKQAIFVSQSGFADNARAARYEIQSKFGIEIRFIQPEDLLETKKRWKISI